MAIQFNSLDYQLVIFAGAKFCSLSLKQESPKPVTRALGNEELHIGTQTFRLGRIDFTRREFRVRMFF